MFSYLLSLGPSPICTKWPQNDLKHYTVKGISYIFHKKPWVPNFTPLCSTIARFPHNKGFRFLRRAMVNMKCWKKIVKKRNSKFQNPKRISMRIVEWKIQEKFENFWPRLVEVAFWNFHSNWVPCKWKRKKNHSNFNFQNFKIPKRNFVRTIDNIV